LVCFNGIGIMRLAKRASLFAAVFAASTGAQSLNVRYVYI